LIGWIEETKLYGLQSAGYWSLWESQERRIFW
jgi:hypothetical protein